MAEGESNLSFDSEHRLRSENLSFDIDVWYPQLKDFTFKSVFVPLKRIEAVAIREFHNVSWRHVKESLSNEEIESIIALESDITNVLTTEFGGKGAFMRLCGRSPKDGEPLDREGPVQDYLGHIQEILREQNNNDFDVDALTTLASVKDIDPNIKMAAIARVSWLKVKNGKDALSLLLTSERVYAEMVDWLKFGEPEQLCFREWEPELKLEFEFRAFVCKGVLTCISQYDHYAYYPRLHALRERLLRGIYDFWKVVHDHIKLQGGSYVIDIGYLLTSDSFIVIELSPFTPCTGAALFQWREDSGLLQGSNFKTVASNISALTDEEYVERIVFRLKAADEVHPQLNDLVDMNWDDRWKTYQSPYWEVFTYGREAQEEQERETEQRESSFLSTVVSGAMSWFHNATMFVGRSSSSSSAETANSVVSGGCSPSNNNSNVSLDSTKSPPQLANSETSGTTCTNDTTLLFVYGTLKRGFQWNSKYLCPRLGATFVDTATTVQCYPLVIGDCGVPYLLGCQEMAGHGHCLVGELWRVGAETLQGLDDYEGVGKGYYCRIEIPVAVGAGYGVGCVEGDNSTSSAVVLAQVYIYSCFNEDLQSRQFIPEYILADHQALYCPMLHIQRKQNAYIGKPSLWGKTDTDLDDTLNPAN